MTNPQVLQALLAMDAYNQGEDQGVPAASGHLFNLMQTAAKAAKASVARTHCDEPEKTVARWLVT